MDLAAQSEHDGRVRRETARAPRRSLRERIRALRAMAARLGEGVVWRGYWPETLRRPWLRLALACAVAPALMSLIAAAIHAGFFYVTGPLGFSETPGLAFSIDSHAIEAFHDYIDIFYRATLLWFPPSFVVLVMATLRSRRAYGILALIAATFEFAIAAVIHAAPQPLIFFGTAILYPPLFLTIHALTGIGRHREGRANR